MHGLKNTTPHMIWTHGLDLYWSNIILVIAEQVSVGKKYGISVLPWKYFWPLELPERVLGTSRALLWWLLSLILSLFTFLPMLVNKAGRGLEPNTNGQPQINITCLLSPQILVSLKALSPSDTLPFFPYCPLSFATKNP